MFAPPREFDPNHPELIDRPGLDDALLAEELATLEAFNRRSGGHRLLLESIEPLVAAVGANPVRILDLATGGADIPRALATSWRARPKAVAITAVDMNPAVIRFARAASTGFPEIEFQQHDLRVLPFAPASFDIVLCSLALHHFSAAEAVLILRRIGEIARAGFVVSDLRRNYAAIWITNLLVGALTRSPIFRHDASQSCRAAFTVEELAAMASQADLQPFQITRAQGVFKMILTGRR